MKSCPAEGISSTVYLFDPSTELQGNAGLCVREVVALLPGVAHLEVTKGVAELIRTAHLL